MKRIFSVFLALLLCINAFKVRALSTSASCAVLIDADSGKVLYAKNEQTKASMASTTKIMTALLLCENKDLSDTLLITDKMVMVEGTSMGLKSGMTVTYKDLLYGMLLASGNDAANATAIGISGSIEKFVELMNTTAKELGMEYTHFVTSTGLHDDQHYTTVKDLAKLVQYALENETFKMIYSSKTYTTAPTKKYPQGLTFYNTMFSRLGNNELENGKILGGKTGYTSEAGNCLASYAMVDGEEYILVTAGSMDESKKGPVKDAVLIYNQINK